MPLPKALVEAMERRDWATVRDQPGTVMDGMTTDGAYGRALLQLALELPIGVDPIFDSYRGAASIDHGDWDGLRRCLAGGPVEPVQLFGMRDVLLAPLKQVAPKDPASGLCDALRAVRVPTESDGRKLSALGAGDAELPGYRARMRATRRARLHLLPLLALVDENTFLRSARIAEQIAAGLGSARAQLASHAWRLAAESIKTLGEPHP